MNTTDFTPGEKIKVYYGKCIGVVEAEVKWVGGQSILLKFDREGLPSNQYWPPSALARWLVQG